MSETVIQVENVSKLYRLGEVGTGSLAHDVNRWWHRVRGKEDPYRKVGETNEREQKGDSDYAWALRGVSFEVKRGEVLGIIGRNGAGKSTLLKILSRITSQTEGRIKIKGRVSSLLEVGTGFHPELTGRENVFLYGAILGMTKAEIRSKFDEIVAFSGVEQFIDTPVKRYSSGMYVRLAFAVAAHLEAEILIVDEVLAVGDAAFQKKCLETMQSLTRDAGRTILFVSHQMATVAALCSRMVLLRDGEIDFTGPTAQGIQRYLASGEATLAERRKSTHSAAGRIPYVRDAWMERNGERKDQFLIGDENVTANIVVASPSPSRCAVELVLRDEKGHAIAFAPSGLQLGVEYELSEGLHSITCALPPLMLASGAYSLDILLAESGVRLIDSIESGVRFTIEPSFYGPAKWNFPQQINRGCILWNVKFRPSELPNGGAANESLA